MSSEMRWWGGSVVRLRWSGKNKRERPAGWHVSLPPIKRGSWQVGDRIHCCLRAQQLDMKRIIEGRDTTWDGSLMRESSKFWGTWKMLVQSATASPSKVAEGKRHLLIYRNIKRQKKTDRNKGPFNRYFRFLGCLIYICIFLPVKLFFAEHSLWSFFFDWGLTFL